MNQPPPAESNGSDARQTMNFVMFVIQAYATSIEVFLHVRFGERYLGFQAAAVLLLVPLHAYFLQDNDQTWLLCCLLPYLVACLVQRAIIVTYRLRGEVTHSRYNGFPWLLIGNTRFDEVTFKHWIEPLLVMIGGMFLLPADVGCGSYLIAGGAALYLKGQMNRQYHHVHQLDMQDAMLEQQQRAEQFRPSNDPFANSLRGRSDQSWR